MLRYLILVFFCKALYCITTARDRVSGCDVVCNQGDPKAFDSFAKCIYADTKSRGLNELLEDHVYALYTSACEAKQQAEFQEYVQENLFSWALFAKNTLKHLADHLPSPGQVCTFLICLLMFTYFAYKSWQPQAVESPRVGVPMVRLVKPAQHRNRVMTLRNRTVMPDSMDIEDEDDEDDDSYFKGGRTISNSTTRGTSRRNSSKTLQQG